MVKCPVCNNNNLKIIHTEAAPFMAERMFSVKHLPVDLILCNKCTFAWYSLRPTEEMNANFYKGYRNYDYQAQRQKHEPWYTKEINNTIGKSKVEAQNRSNNLSCILQEYTNLKKFKTVLDYGGDKGQHIPPVLDKAKKYVFDLSGSKPQAGVTALKTQAEANKNKYDFIMCSHLLEHVHNPNAVVSNLKRLLNKNGVLYLELPYEFPFTWANPAKIKFDIKTLLYKLGLRKKPVFYPMHEHINYFTPAAIKYLLEKEGFKIIYLKRKKLDFGWTKAQIISALAETGQ